MRRFRSRGRKATSQAAAAASVAVVMALAALGYGLYTGSTSGSEASSMRSTISAQAGQIAALQSGVSSLQSTLAGANGQLNSTRSTLEANVTSLEGRLAALGQELNSTESADSATIQRLSAEVQGLNETLQSLEGQFVTHTGPSLFQESGTTCSSPCSSESADVTLSSDVREGDMLVVTVVSDDLTHLVVEDSLGTMLTLAVSSTTSPACSSNSGSCQADIYWGIFPSTGPDSVTVSEPGSTVALRVQAWEFSGVGTVRSTVACEPYFCPSDLYPSSAILIATGEAVTGAGTGFAWYPYPISGVAGTEYEIVYAAGSTNFPFYNVVTDVEAAAVLVPGP